MPLGIIIRMLVKHWRLSVTSIKFWVQDSAAMLILHPEYSCSTFFKVLPFLTSDNFESFRGEMRSTLLGTKDPMENNSLDIVIPGLVR